MRLAPGVAEYLLSLADDEHLIGHRHTEWIGVAPFLEEDLAFASIGQDELGHGIALYDLLVADVDHEPFRRSADEWRSCWLVELPCRDWAAALARHWLYDLAERHRWVALTGSSLADVAGIAGRALREETYHRRHACGLVDRLLADGGEARDRLVAAVDAVLTYALGLFEAPAGEAAALADGVASTSMAEMGEAWRTEVDVMLADGGVAFEWPAPIDGQLARTARSPDFADLHADLTAVFRLDPDAVW
ncbi:MAG: 1,2-phenylacetyl-CoA epoxidase subunit PaaC [Acidimicrobiales bacterium]